MSVVNSNGEFEGEPVEVCRETLDCPTFLSFKICETLCTVDVENWLLGCLVDKVADISVEVPFKLVCAIDRVEDVVGDIVVVFGVDVVGTLGDNIGWLVVNN